MPRKPLNQDLNSLMDNVKLETEQVVEDPNFATMVDSANTEATESKPKTTETVDTKVKDMQQRKSPDELNRELAHAMRQLDKITKLFNMTTQLYITDGPNPKRFECIEDELEYKISEVQRRIVKTYNAYNQMTELYVSDNMN